jgi:nucleolar protein 9
VPQEKIARSLFAHEQDLNGSFYGKFFARNLNLYMLQRKPDDWKNLQSQHKLSSQLIKAAPADPSIDMSAASAIPAKKPTKRKRDTLPDNEIDALFDASLGKKIKKGILESEQAVKGIAEHITTSSRVKDKELNDVLVAIRAAPKDGKGSHWGEKRAR